MLRTLRDALASYLNTATVLKSAPKLRHNVNRWERHSSIEIPITTADVERFRASCVEAKLAATTIETTISDVVTILRGSGCAIPDVGRRLPQTKRTGQNQPSLSDVAKVYVVATQANWPRRTRRANGKFQRWSQAERTALFRGFLFLDVWTALRLGDITNLQAENIHDDSIEKQADKTGSLHIFPIVHDVQRHIDMLSGLDPDLLIPIKKGSRRFLRAELRRLCEIARVRPFLPKQIRKLSITEWACTGTDAGRIVHGMGLGVLDSYYDGFKILQRAAHKFCLPIEMRDPDQTKEVEQFLVTLMAIARRMRTEQLAILTKLAEAL